MGIITGKIYQHRTMAGPADKVMPNLHKRVLSWAKQATARSRHSLQQLNLYKHAQVTDDGRDHTQR